MPFDWKANSNIVITGLVSIIFWIGFVIGSSKLQNQIVGGVCLIIAIGTLLRFGYLLDKSLEGVM